MIKIDLELFQDLEELEEIPENITINGDVNIEINLSNDKTHRIIKNAKQKRAAVKSPWKSKIKSRDENRCQCCKKTFEDHLEVHHIFPFSKFPDLAMDDGNGIALCQKCHSKYHNIYKGQEDAVTFAKFLRDFGERRY